MPSPKSQAAPKRKTVNLALQGGGAHGAFTWGVLDRLLDEKQLAFEGLSATSAGSMNAAAFAYGLAVGGREGARKALTDYWKRVSEAARLGPLQPTLIDRTLADHRLSWSPILTLTANWTPPPTVGEPTKSKFSAAMARGVS